MATKRFRIAIVPDSFKGSLSALEAAECIERGLRRSMANLSVKTIPIADGGDGTAQAVVDGTGGRMVRRTVRDPLGRKIRSEFGLTGDGRCAVVEMAKASGLVLLKEAERNPLLTSTYGTGQLIGAATKLGVKEILVGIGGSATNDGGTGMARALGLKFLDRQGCELPEGGGDLARLRRIDASGLSSSVREIDIEVACDVDNPLLGEHGASRVYGPQKGATEEMIERLDRGLARLADVIERDLGVRIADVPGAGAAGGLGAGLMAFLGGRLRPGIEIVIDVVKLGKQLRGRDLVITGEGRMDGQTAYGKAPAGVAKVAGSLGIPVIAISGSVTPEAAKVLDVGIDAYLWALQEPVRETDLRARGPQMLEDCAAQVGRLLTIDLAGRTRLRRRRAARGPRTRAKK